MRDDPSREAVRLLQALVARETGEPLTPSAETEMAAIVERALGGEAAMLPFTHSFVRREVTILIADLRGFTAITAALPTETVIAMLNRCLGRMNEVVFRHHGVVDKFMGDSIMVLFGVPEEHPEDVRRALACAIDMQLEMQALNKQNQQEGIAELFMGIGINSGSVMAGKFGSHLYSEYTVIGEEVNLASRIESFSLRGQILIGENTYDHCRDFVTVSAAMEVYVKGKAQSVKLRELLAIPSLQLEVKRNDSRRSHRVAVNLPCSFMRLKNKIVMPNKTSALVCDIGYNGMLLEFEGDLNKLDDIKLEFDIPLVGFKISEVYAKVVQLRVADGRRYAGVEFTSLNTDANMKIQFFVQMLLTAEQELKTDLQVRVRS